MIPKNRDDDIGFRGDIKVHDYDGSIKLLSQSKVWYNYDDEYVPPREFEVCCFLDWLHNMLSITI